MLLSASAFERATDAQIASDGLNLGADLKSVGDIKDLFVYFRDKILPVLEQAYADLKKDIPTAQTAARR